MTAEAAPAAAWPEPPRDGYTVDDLFNLPDLPPLRGLAFSGQVSGRYFMRQFAISHARRGLHMEGDSQPPSGDVCDCTRIRCIG
jgi:hypothetical protein